MTADLDTRCGELYAWAAKSCLAGSLVAMVQRGVVAAAPARRAIRPCRLGLVRAGSSSSRCWVVRGDELDINTPQTPGMTRAAAVTTARTGAEKLWAGTG